MAIGSKPTGRLGSGEVTADFVQRTKTVGSNRLEARNFLFYAMNLFKSLSFTPAERSNPVTVFMEIHARGGRGLSASAKPSAQRGAGGNAIHGVYDRIGAVDRILHHIHSRL